MLKSIIRFYLPLLALILFANLPEAMPLLRIILTDRIANSLSGIHDFLHENTEGFLVILGIGIYFEHVSGPRTVDLTQKALDNISDQLRKPARTASSKDQLSACLNNIYASQDTKSLVEAVFTNKPILSDVDVKLRLSDCQEDDSFFMYSSSISFKCSSKLISIALASEHAHQALLATLPGITFSRTLPLGLDTLKLEANKTGIVAEISDGNRVETATITKMNKREIEKIVAGISFPPQSVYFFKIEVDKSNFYRMTINFPEVRLRKDCYYVFWSADSPIFLRSISIDASAFNTDRREKFDLHCNLLSYKSIDLTYRKSGYITVSTESWLSYGQGVIFSWR